MTEGILHQMRCSTVVQGMGGVCVTQPVRGNGFVNPGPDDGLPNDIVNLVSREGGAGGCSEDGTLEGI